MNPSEPTTDRESMFVAEINRLTKERDQAKSIISKFGRMIEFAEKVNDDQSEKEVALSASFSEAMALEGFAQSEAEVRALRAELSAAKEERRKLIETIQDAQRIAVVDVTDGESELWREVESFFGRARQVWEDQLSAANAAREKDRYEIEALREELREAQLTAGLADAYEKERDDLQRKLDDLISQGIRVFNDDRNKLQSQLAEAESKLAAQIEAMPIEHRTSDGIALLTYSGEKWIRFSKSVERVEFQMGIIEKVRQTEANLRTQLAEALATVEKMREALKTGLPLYTYATTSQAKICDECMAGYQEGEYSHKAKCASGKREAAALSLQPSTALADYMAPRLEAAYSEAWITSMIPANRKMDCRTAWQQSETRKLKIC